MIKNQRFAPVIIACALVIIPLSAALWNLYGDSCLLINEKNACWIRYPEPFRLHIHYAKKTTTGFRTTLPKPIAGAPTALILRTAGDATVFIDKKAVFFSHTSKLQKIGDKHRVDLSPFLETDNHELRIDVSRTEGHPLLIAWSETSSLFTGAHWEASRDGSPWVSAVPADKVSPLPLSRDFPGLKQSIGKLAPLYFFLFLLFLFWNIRAAEPIRQRYSIKSISADTARWLVILAWLAMAINNFWKLPVDMGMDFKGHMQYILHLVETRRIPFATEGWQMFQQPLYYLLTSVLYDFLHRLFTDETSIRAIKLISVLSGILQVEIAYRTLKLVYPTNVSIQKYGIVFAGFLPMNIYMSQSLGNEPLAAALVSFAILTAVRLAQNENTASRESALFMGFLLGLALLAKVSAVLIVLPLFFFIASKIFEKKGFVKESLMSAAVFSAPVGLAAFSVSGWYYIRNYMEMGSFFIGGWDVSRDIVWWQDPGYRTLQQLYHFGESLYYPVFSSIYGFWDSLYSTFWADGFISAYNRPPWNYPFMMTGMWLSLLPTAAIVIGGIAAVRMETGKLRRVLLFSAGSVLLYLVAIFSMFITVPFWSSGKASYALGLLPCFALLAAAGFDRLAKNRVARSVSLAFFGLWAIASYLCYFAL